jgi:hypothetical protein
MNKKILFLGLCFLAGTTKVFPRRIPLQGTCTKATLNDALLKAALEGNIPKMRNLIKAGADVNSQQFDTLTYSGQDQNYYGPTKQTILIKLLSRNEVDADILKFLINEAGANPKLTDSKGDNAFTLTADNIDQELHDILNGKTKTTA